MASFRQVNVGITPIQLAPINGNRKALIFINRGTADLYIGASNAISTVIGPAAIATQFRAQEQLNFGADPDEFWAVATSGTQRVDVIEIV
jgi:hypothetical protein